jgi:hypothetical protein
MSEGCPIRINKISPWCDFMPELVSVVIPGASNRGKMMCRIEFNVPSDQIQIKEIWYYTSDEINSFKCNIIDVDFEEYELRGNIVVTRFGPVWKTNQNIYAKVTILYENQEYVIQSDCAEIRGTC